MQTFHAAPLVAFFLAIAGATPATADSWSFADSGGGIMANASAESRMLLKGKRIGLGIPAPASPTQLFSGSTAVTVQMHGNGNCWETSFEPGQSTNEPNSYKSKF